MSGDGNERLGGRARVTALGQGQSREPGEAGLYLCVPAPPPGPEGPPVPKPTGRGSCRCPIFCLLPLGICFILWKGEELGELYKGGLPCSCWSCSARAWATTRTWVQIQRAPSPCSSLDSPSRPHPVRPPLQQLSSALGLHPPPPPLPHLRSQKQVIGAGWGAPGTDPQPPCGYPQPGCWPSTAPQSLLL